MKKPLRAAEAIWKSMGRSEGITITSGLDGTHTAHSWHYFGAAIDLRNRYFNEEDKGVVMSRLREALPGYDIVEHSTHIHIEPGNPLARQWGLLL